MAMRFISHDIHARREMILHGNPMRVLLMLSLPTVLMAFVQSLIPITDGLFLNNAGSYVVASAVGYANPVINMLGALSQGLATAAMAILGQTYGRGDIPTVRRYALQILAFGLALGIAVAPVCIVAARVLSGRLEDPALARAVFLYLACNAAILPFIFMAAIFNAIKNATGQPEATFYRMTLLLLLKLVFNALFLSVLHLGVVGAALASLSAYLLIGVWMYHDLFVQIGDMRLDLEGFRFDGQIIRQLLRLGIPVMLSSATMNLGFFLINNEIVGYGTVVFNAQTIASNLNALTFTVPSSLGTTITTMVSIKIAAGQLREAKRAFYHGLLVALGLAALFIALFFAFARPLVGLYLRNPNLDDALRSEIGALAVSALHIYTISIIGFAVVMAAQGAFIGLGRTKLPLLGGVLRIWLFRYLFILVFSERLGVYAVFYGNLFSNLLTGLIFFVIIVRIDWTRALIALDSPRTPGRLASWWGERRGRRDGRAS